jgi:hypothetical protein
MKNARLWPVMAVLVPLVVGACAIDGATSAMRPAHTVEAVGKVIDSLASEATQRGASDDYRGLPVVVTPAHETGNPAELIIAEFLRTRLHERGMTVRKVCGARCLEITLQEFATSAPDVSRLSPGQIFTVATGSVPVLGSLTRNLTEREREMERAAARTTGLLVTFAARDGERYTARSHVVAIMSTSSGEVALEQR